tara:strand:+ start:131 stop:748 length:618 start_codon:yes stop_codon:yes gene_type:complete
MISKSKSLFASAFCALSLLLATPSAVFAAADKHAESSGSLPQFDVTTFPSQIFWLAITFVVLYTIFSAKVLPEISSVIENRKNTIDTDLNTAEKLRNEADEVQKNYENQLSLARQNAQELKRKSDEDGRKDLDRRLNEFQKRAEREQKNTLGRIEQSKQEVMGDLNDMAAEVVQNSIEKITGVQISKEDALKFVENYNIQQKRAA